MKARKRFLLLFLILVFIYFLFKKFHKSQNKTDLEFDFYSKHVLNTRSNREWTSRECRMSTCFDFSRCRDLATSGLRVHLYGDREAVRVSESFAKITEIVKTSIYYESDPNKACLFLAVTWDPLDRDPLSRDFQKPHSSMSTIDVLFNGSNHIFLNLYSGSWPNYEELDFNFNQNYGKIKTILKKAIFIKASQSRDAYREGWDVSLPLFSRNHPKRGQTLTQSSNNIMTSNEKTIGRHSSSRRYLLVFKGKRYIYGIGSETRNSLHYLNNDRDVLIVTTCRHGKKWKDWKDDKCDTDNSIYDKHDYQQLMANSTFCLVPRGRRLGSYRFLEALQLGCIPVVLSNSWVLPFQEVIDWNSCVVLADERLLFQIPEILRSFSSLKIQTMKQKCLHLYDTYFSSIERIIFTSFGIIEKRIQNNFQITNLVTKTQFAPQFQSSNRSLTVIIHVTKPDDVTDCHKLVQKLNSQTIKEFLIIWSIVAPLPYFKSTKVRIIKSQNKFQVFPQITTDAIFRIHPKSLITAEEIEFAFNIWLQFSNRIIGFIARDHSYNADKHVFEYSSKWTNHYSSVSLDSALYHSLYDNVFSEFLAKNQFFNQSLENNCLDLAFVFLISHLTREGPIKVTQRKRDVTCSDSYSDWTEKRICFESLQQLFSYLPLISSSVRFDPLLYKDLVSVKRKKYPKMESNV